MGTNYYLEPRLTKAERRTIDRLNAKLPHVHIGKSSIGWTFSFHAPSRWDLDVLLELKSINFDELTEDIVSAVQWYEWTNHPDLQIVDEYGKLVGHCEFWSMVEEKKADRLNHATEAKKNQWSDSFHDSEGNSFSTGEFS